MHTYTCNYNQSTFIVFLGAVQQQYCYGNSLCSMQNYKILCIHDIKGYNNICSTAYNYSDYTDKLNTQYVTNNYKPSLKKPYNY